MKSTLVALILGFAATIAAGAQAVTGPAPVEESLPVVRLFTQGKPVGVSENFWVRMGQQAIGLVKSSSLHSGLGDKYHVFTLAGVQQDYRDAIATGEYVVMILSPVQTINTLEGEVTAAEIVVGLQSPNSKNTVFTIDASGAIVGHAKYSYEALMALKQAVAESRL